MGECKNQKIRRFWVFVLFLGYLEIVFQLLIYNTPTWGMLYGSLFAVPAAALFTLLSGWGPPRLNKIITSILFVVLEVFFIAQSVYYDIFRTYLQVFSIANGAGNALEFISVIINSLGKIWWKILFLLLPLIGYFVMLLRGYIDFERQSWKQALIRLLLCGVSHGIVLLTLFIGGTGAHSPYALYYNEPVLQMCVKNLGVVTTMRRDTQRMILGSPEKGFTLSSNSSKKEESSKPESSMEESKAESKAESSEESSIPEEEIFVPEPNIQNIDFERLIDEAPNDTVMALHQYFQNTEPTYTNEYTGMFEGYNLIWVIAESFSDWIIDEERMPTLYKMSNSGFVFNNFYTPYWSFSTTDGEWVTHTSLLPREDIWCYYHSSEMEMPFGFGNMFGGLGYTCRGYHSHDYDYYYRELSHPNMGYVWKGNGNGLYMSDLWPESDKEMMELTVPEYINNEPFHIYYLTISGHTLWNFRGDNDMSTRYEDLVQDLPYGDQVKAYIACEIEVDRALEYLLEELEKAGVADHTVIAFSVDHYPYALSTGELDEIYGGDTTEDFNLYQNCFMIYCPGMEETVQVDKLGSSLDIAPTLANLFNLPYDSRLYMGTDLLSDSEPLVMFSDRSFMNDKMLYNASTGEVKFYEEECTQDYVDEMIGRVNDKFTVSSAIIDCDYYSYLKEYLPWWDGEAYGHLYDPETEDPKTEESEGE